MSKLTYSKKMLTTLASKLFAILQSRQGEWVSQEEILLALPELRTSENEKSHDKCTKIWSLVNELNNSTEIENIVLIKNFTYKIATEEEAINDVKSYMKNRIVPMLNRYWVKVRKIKKDGQFDLFKEDFIETFIKEQEERWSSSQCKELSDKNEAQS